MSYKHNISKLIFLLGIILFIVLETSEGIKEYKHEAEVLNGTEQAIRIPPIITESEGKASLLKIVGGSSATLGQFRYTVSLKYGQTGQYFCGGSIISDKWILTSASCLDGKSPSDITVVVGSINLNSGGTPYQGSRMFIHEAYHYPQSAGNDVAVLEVVGTITFTPNVNKIGLGTQPPLTPKSVVVSGYGFTSFPGAYSNILQYVQLTTLPYLQCNNNLPEENPPLPLGTVCTSTQAATGVCVGDRGGPVVDFATGRQIGIVSWNIPCAVGNPDVHTCVPFFRRWILENTGGRL